MARNVSSVSCERVSARARAAMRGSAAHILHVGTILRNEISHFHVSNSLWKLCHLSAIMTAQRHDKLLHVMRDLQAAGFNCRVSLRMMNKRQRIGAALHITFDIELVQPGLKFRRCLQAVRGCGAPGELEGGGGRGHAYIRSI